MTETELKALLKTVTPPDEAARAAAHAHWAALAKPLGGLGQLETMLEDAAALTGSAELDFSRRAVLVLCADNGVVAQGVSQTDASVTRTVAVNLAARRTSVCRMAAAARCTVVPVDMGIAGAPVPGVVDCRVAPGTRDFTESAAMTRAEAVQAVAAGIALVRAQKAQGVQLLATGEMGIGNTTTSSAVAAVLLDRPAAEMAGRGAGLSDAGLRRKIDAIERGIAVTTPTPPTRWTCWKSWEALILPGCAVCSLAVRWKMCPSSWTASSAAWLRSAPCGSARRQRRLSSPATRPASPLRSACWRRWTKKR